MDLSSFSCLQSYVSDTCYLQQQKIHLWFFRRPENEILGKLSTFVPKLALLNICCCCCCWCYILLWSIWWRWWTISTGNMFSLIADENTDIHELRISRPWFTLELWIPKRNMAIPCVVYIIGSCSFNKCFIRKVSKMCLRNPSVKSVPHSPEIRNFSPEATFFPPKITVFGPAFVDFRFTD